MSLLYDATAELVTVAASSELNSLDPYTVFQLWNQTGGSEGANHRLWSREEAGGGKKIFFLTGISPFLQWRHIVVRADGNAIAATLDFGQDQWEFAGCTFDSADSQVCRIYRGTLTTAVAEVTYDGAPVNSSGAVDADTGDKIIGNTSAAGKAFQGRIALHMVFNEKLSVAQMEAQRIFAHPIPSCVEFLPLGFIDAGTQPDWSTNGNNGTPTGVTQADHAPLPSSLIIKRRRRYEDAAVAAGGVAQLIFLTGDV